MNSRAVSWFGISFFLLLPYLEIVGSDGSEDVLAERRVHDYLRTHVKPGENFSVSKLYNEVFTTPADRGAFDRLYNVVFKLPSFIVEYYLTAQKPPSLNEIAQQFHLTLEGEAETLLRILEYDQRVPRFFSRDPKSGEIMTVDAEKIKVDPRFNKVVERSLAGWEGKPAPGFAVQSIDGGRLALSDYRGKICLLYFWFTHCPPCVQITPHLVSLQKKYQASGFVVVGMNADQFLELDYSDRERQSYIHKNEINFPVAHMSAEVQGAYGGVSLFPTLFLIDRAGIVRAHFVNYQEERTIEKAIEPLLR
ncbi:MAG TPA: TlpA disulfide reductase family protein [Terriglobia bacterium]|nr:TlpA disulfide reductase family protein [Terriglobia bacterium]